MDIAGGQRWVLRRTVHVKSPDIEHRVRRSDGTTCEFSAFLVILLPIIPRWNPQVAIVINEEIVQIFTFKSNK